MLAQQAKKRKSHEGRGGRKAVKLEQPDESTVPHDVKMIIEWFRACIFWHHDLR